MSKIQRLIGSCLFLSGLITLGCDLDSSSGRNDHPRDEKIPDVGDGGENGCTHGEEDDDAGGGEKDCPRTQGFWKNHDWPAHQDEVLCDQNWFDILWTPPRGDAWYILAHQWIATMLNVAAGVEVDDDIDAALLAAEMMLLTCEVDAGDHTAATELADLLASFNESCDEEEDDDDGDDDHGDADDDHGDADDDHGDDDSGECTTTGGSHDDTSGGSSSTGKATH